MKREEEPLPSFGQQVVATGGGHVTLLVGLLFVVVVVGRALGWF